MENSLFSENSPLLIQDYAPINADEDANHVAADAQDRSSDATELRTMQVKLPLMRLD